MEGVRVKVDLRTYKRVIVSITKLELKIFAFRSFGEDERLKVLLGNDASRTHDRSSQYTSMS